MSARVVAKKYVVVIRVAATGGGFTNHRSVPMSLEESMSSVKDYKHDGVDAWHEVASESDLAPLALKKQRLKERKARKKDTEARRLVP